MPNLSEYIFTADKHKRMASVFEGLSIKPKHEKEGKTASLFYAKTILPDFIDINNNLHESLFPNTLSNVALADDLEDKIKEKTQQIKENLADSYTAYHLAYKYLSRVTDVENDVVSLFDKYRIEKAKENLAGENGKYLLVKGDFGGMQKFIYGGIKTDEVGNTAGLSKRLRGRSFYISTMADMIAEEFAEEMELGIENVIYSGGGHFLLLCADNEKNKNTIHDLTKKVNEFLLHNVGSALSFITGQASCGEDVFTDSGKVMMAVNYDLSGKKYKQNRDNLKFVFDIIKEPDFQDDQLLGENIPKINTILEVKFEKEWTKEMKEQYFQLKREEDVVLSFKKFHKLLIMSDNIKLDDLKNIITSYSDVIKSIKVIKINQNSDFLDIYPELTNEIKQKVKIHFGFRYLGNFTPTEIKGNKPSVKPFSEIIKLNNFPKEMSFDVAPYPNKDNKHNSFSPWDNNFAPKYDKREPLSYPRLAVMRLDVDNLGTIFGFGMGEKASLEKTATLSRELHLFFTGYFSVLAKKYDIYITYSGGDDAFVVGSWIGVAHFAKELYHQFKRFVCKNDEITFSAGVFLCDEHYPVAKFAHDAAELEERAKKYSIKNEKNEDVNVKNAITIFNHTLSFPHYDAMLNFSVKMLGYVRTDDESADTHKIARSMVHRLLRIIKSCIDEEKGFSIKMNKLHRQTANLHYLFARHGFNEEEIERARAEREESQKKAKAITKDIMEVILSHFKNPKDAKTLVPNFLIPTHYVTLLTRKEK